MKNLVLILSLFASLNVFSFDQDPKASQVKDILDDLSYKDRVVFCGKSCDPGNTDSIVKYLLETGIYQELGSN